MALNITTLATRWGKIFGGMNQWDTFRGLTIYQRADTINALYPDADEQRAVVDNLYDRTLAVDLSLNDTVSFYMTMARNTLIEMCRDDSLLPIDDSDSAVLQKLVTDMLSQAQTFPEATVQINGADSASGTSVTTMQGPPLGNGAIVGTIINPRTADNYQMVYPETIQFTCSADSYTSGVSPGQEVFNVISFHDTADANSEWPKGSGITTSLTSLPTSASSLLSNAYFSEWSESDVNVPENWSLANLIPGTTITRSTDFYSKDYAVALTAAPNNAELKQLVVGLKGTTNYLIAIRVKKPGVLTTGTLRIALRDATGAILTNAVGGSLSTDITLTGGPSSYTLTFAAVATHKLTAAEVYASIRIVSAMAGGETVLIDNFELIEMVPLYAGGPWFSFIPGAVSWAINDRYTFAVTNNKGKTSFLRNIDRVYPIRDLGIDIPVATPGTQLDSLIS